MSLVVPFMPAVFFSTTTSMFLSMLLQPYCKTILTCCRSQQTLQFLPSSLLKTFPLMATTNAAISITWLKHDDNKMEGPTKVHIFCNLQTKHSLSFQTCATRNRNIKYPLYKEKH